MKLQAVTRLLLGILAVAAFADASRADAIRGGSGHRSRLRRQDAGVGASSASTLAPSSTLVTSTTPIAAPSQTIDDTITTGQATTSASGGGPARDNPTTIATSSFPSIGPSDATSNSVQPSPPATSATTPNSTSSGSYLGSAAIDALYRGQVALTTDMAINVTAGNATFSMMLDTAHECSWLVVAKNFKCEADGLATKKPGVCHNGTVYRSLTWSNWGNGPDGFECHYELGNTTIWGSAEFQMMNITGGTETQFNFLRDAHRMRSSVYGLDNFIHGGAGVLSVLSTPEGCSQNRTLELWRPKGGNSVVYIAPRRSAAGVFSRGEYPVNDVDTINSTASNVMLPATAVNSSAYGQPGCSWGLSIDGFRIDGAGVNGSDSCIVDTMSRFNEIDTWTAGAIAARFQPPGWYDPEVSWFQVACNATPPAQAVSVVLAKHEFVINPLDMILKDVPPYYEGRCYSAFQATNYTSNARCRLGWPLLRNVGLGFNLDTVEWNVTSRPYYKAT